MRELYRSDIDGLRAIAVVPVLLHHLSGTLLPGGFVGVDVFFVISGYLITSQIYQQAREGRFSIKAFYMRRINRIIPALFLVVAATLVSGSILLSPADLVLLVKSALLAMLGVSNIFLWKNYGNYFSGNADEAPLLHTWSLGVEEQFYLIWPLALILLLRWCGKHLLAVLLVLVACGVAGSQVATGIAASLSYYMLPTRFFELMMGGVLAVMVTRPRLQAPPSPALVCLAGLGLISGAMVGLGPASSFPGMNAFWPCLGTVLVIWAGQARHACFFLLANRPMVFVGLISYSLYLWHWPLIAYLNYANIEINLVVGLAVVVGAILLAGLSWKYVEIPMRRSGALLSFARIFSVRLIIPVGVILLMMVSVVRADGWPGRFDQKVAVLEKSVMARPEVLRSGCHVPTALYQKKPDLNACRLGYSKEGIDGMLIGDSFANHFAGMVDVMAKFQGLAFVDYTMDGCPPILGYSTAKAATYAERCVKRNQAAYQLLKERNFDRVILAASWPHSEEAGRLLMHSIEKIRETGASLTLILENQPIERASSCVIRKVMYESEDHCTQPRSAPPDYFKAIRARYPEVKLIDPNEVICRRDVCSPMLDDVLLYRDEVHLNDVGSRVIGEHFLRIGERL